MLGQFEELYREEFTIPPGKSNGKTFQSKFFEQDHLSNLLRKEYPVCTYFKTENNVAQNMIDDFFLILTIGGTFHTKDFKGKNMGFWC